MTTSRLKSLWHDDWQLRRLLLVIDIGLIAFWLYSTAYVFGHPPEKGGDGFEVLATVPVTLVTLFLVLPASLLLISNRTLRIGIFVTLAAIVADASSWNQIAWHAGLGRTWVCSSVWTLCW